ncbi:MAG: hypothetical protein IKM68_03335 [Bacteroidaceae bacterium]|nr:hypothetical protein [Bacteroidaceae bacterium]
MKKTFKTFALMLLTAFALSSCVDVPAPFNLPDKSSSSDGGGSSSNEGTPVTCAQAVELTKALADGATSSEVYTITGYITEVVGNVSKNQQTFWMADTKDGGRIFEAFWANLPEGVSAFTKGTKVKITGKLMKYVNTNNGNVIAEMKNATVTILTDDGGDTPAEDVIPVSCVIAAQTANSLPDNATSEETYCVTGYITKVIGAVSTKYGTPQQSFWMADKMEDGEIFQAYYANLPEGVSEFVIGMKVKITGKLLNYKNANGGGAAEMKNATVVILEEGGGGETPPVGDVINVTCAEAAQLVDGLSNGGTSAETYAVTGYITETDGKISRNQQIIWMADTKDGGKVFEGYWANLPSGVSALTVGMKVTMTGKLMKYVNNTTGEVTPEIKNGDIVILEQGDGGQGGGGDTPGPTPGPGGDEVTELVNGGFEEWVSDSQPLGWKSSSTASNAILSKSQDAHGGSYACVVAAPGSANKRLATQEITLEAGTYTFSFYAKSTTADKSQTKCGYVPVADGAVGAYKYGDFFDLNNNGWTLVSYEFTLEATTTVCLVVMNPKDSNYSKSQDILVDDATLVKK